jgi:hypothetical protein
MFESLDIVGSITSGPRAPSSALTAPQARSCAVNSPSTPGPGVPMGPKYSIRGSDGPGSRAPEA